MKKQEELLLDQPAQSCKLEWTDKSYSREEIFSEYLNFLKHLPKLITSEKKKILNTVRSKLRIQQIEENIGYSLRILTPPLDKCLMCREELTVNNKATQIVVFTLNGPELFSNYILRCKSCRLWPKEEFKLENNYVRQDVYYHPDKYGNVKGG